MTAEGSSGETAPAPAPPPSQQTPEQSAPAAPPTVEIIPLQPKMIIKRSGKPLDTEQRDNP